MPGWVWCLWALGPLVGMVVLLTMALVGAEMRRRQAERSAMAERTQAHALVQAAQQDKLRALLMAKSFEEERDQAVQAVRSCTCKLAELVTGELPPTVTRSIPLRVTRDTWIRDAELRRN